MSREKRHIWEPDDFILLPKRIERMSQRELVRLIRWLRADGYLSLLTEARRRLDHLRRKAGPNRKGPKIR